MMPKSTRTKALAMPIRQAQDSKKQPPLPAVNNAPGSSAKASTAVGTQVPAIANRQRPRAKKRTQAQMQEEDQQFILPAGEKRQRWPSGTYAQMNTGGETAFPSVNLPGHIGMTSCSEGRMEEVPRHASLLGKIIKDSLSRSCT